MSRRVLFIRIFKILKKELEFEDDCRYLIIIQRMRKGTHLSRYGRLHSFRNFTLANETKARSFKDLPSTSKTLQDVPGPKGIYNLPFVGSALEMYPYSK